MCKSRIISLNKQMEKSEKVDEESEKVDEESEKVRRRVHEKSEKN